MKSLNSFLMSELVHVGCEGLRAVWGFFQGGADGQCAEHSQTGDSRPGRLLEVKSAALHEEKGCPEKQGGSECSCSVNTLPSV